MKTSSKKAAKAAVAKTAIAKAVVVRYSEAVEAATDAFADAVIGIDSARAVQTLRLADLAIAMVQSPHPMTAGHLADRVKSYNPASTIAAAGLEQYARMVNIARGSVPSCLSLDAFKAGVAAAFTGSRNAQKSLGDFLRSVRDVAKAEQKISTKGAQALAAASVREANKAQDVQNAAKRDKAKQAKEPAAALPIVKAGKGSPVVQVAAFARAGVATSHLPGLRALDRASLTLPQCALLDAAIASAEFYVSTLDDLTKACDK